jgi:hypothetical protein
MSDPAKTQRKPFFQTDEDELDSAADRIALAKNIPTLKPPVAPPAKAPPVPVQAAKEQAVVGRSAPQPTPHPVNAGFTQIRVRCPNPVSDQLVLEQRRLRTVGQRVTLNYLILKALQTAGYRVEEADLVEDGRRLR